MKSTGRCCAALLAWVAFFAAAARAQDEEQTTRVGALIRLADDEAFLQGFAKLGADEQQEVIDLFRTPLAGWSAVEAFEDRLLDDKQQWRDDWKNWFASVSGPNVEKRWIEMARHPFLVKLRLERGHCRTTETSRFSFSLIREANAADALSWDQRLSNLESWGRKLYCDLSHWLEPEKKCVWADGVENLGKSERPKAPAHFEKQACDHELRLTAVVEERATDPGKDTRREELVWLGSEKTFLDLPRSYAWERLRLNFWHAVERLATPLERFSKNLPARLHAVELLGARAREVDYLRRRSRLVEHLAQHPLAKEAQSALTPVVASTRAPASAPPVEELPAPARHSALAVAFHKRWHAQAQTLRAYLEREGLFLSAANTEFARRLERARLQSLSSELLPVLLEEMKKPAAGERDLALEAAKRVLELWHDPVARGYLPTELEHLEELEDIFQTLLKATEGHRPELFAEREALSDLEREAEACRVLRRELRNRLEMDGEE